jgi:branched-chain amino acid transport system substrate-binding protein
MRKIFILTIIMGVFCFYAEGWAQPLKVGAVVNLTGPISSWGVYHAKGLQDYLRYVNEVKGGVVGRKIDLTIVDHAYKIPEGVKFVKMFCEEKKDMIITWDTGLGIQAKPIIQEYKIPTLNMSSGKEVVNPPNDYMYLPIATYDLDCYAIMEYIRTIHKGKEAPKVGLLTLNTAYGKTVHSPSKEAAAKFNVNVVEIVEFPPRTVDLSTEVLNLKGKNVEYIFTQILGANMISAFKAADRLNYNPSFIATWTATDPDFFPMAKGIMGNRLKMQFFGCLPQDNTPGAKLIADLIKRYKSVERYDVSYWVGVLMGMTVERAMHRASGLFGKIEPETINKALETFQNEDFGGIVPYLTFTKDNHSGSFKARITQVNEDGTFTPLTNFFTPGKGEIKILK